MDVMRLTKALKMKAGELGFSLVGVVKAQPSRYLDAYMAWIQQEMHGTMGYMARPDRIIRRQDLNVIVPNVQSMVCVGLDYASLKVPPKIAHDPSRGRIANYAWGIDYHDLMTPRLRDLAAWLQQTAGGEVASKVYVDTGAILERSHAEDAGLGFTGKNTMLINSRRGSFFFLGELLTDLPLVPDEMKVDQPSCGRCTRCLEACPTNAFPQPYVLDARRCISYLTIEMKGWIPRELRPLMGNWVYGCDICQDVCPFNRFVRLGGDFRPKTPDNIAPPLLDLLALDRDTFKQRFAHSPIKRIKRTRLLRNACVAAGNWGNPAANPRLTTLLHDDAPLLRGHAAWALGQIDPAQAQQRVAPFLDAETDEQAYLEMAQVCAHL